VKSGINCCVNIDPIIPFITDSEQQITNIVNKCQQSGLEHISGSVLRMRYDIWSRIRQVLELMNLPWAIKEYEQLYDFQEPIVHENNLTADELYTDKVMSILKYQVLNKNIEFGFEKLIAKISKVKQQFPVSLQQCRISEFL
jgi:DNA repair photolyase